MSGNSEATEPPKDPVAAAVKAANDPEGPEKGIVAVKV